MSTQEPSPEEIEENIKGTRARIDDSIESLQDQISPTQIAGQAVSYAREHGGAIASSVGRTVREHPVPVILTAAGLAWLAFSSRKKANTQPDVPSYDGGADTGVVGKAGEKLANAGSSVKNAAGVVQDKGSQAVSAAGTFAEEHPLAVGAIGLALGAIIGTALAPTQREDRVLGPKADGAKAFVKDTAKEKVEQAREVAAAAVDSGVERAKTEADEKGLTPEALKAQSAKSSKS